VTILCTLHLRAKRIPNKAGKRRFFDSAIAELFQTELFPFNFIFMCDGPLIYVWLYPLIYVCLLFFSSNVNTATPDHFSAWFPQSRKGYKMTS